MYLIIEEGLEKNKKYWLDERKKFFSNSYGKIDLKEIATIGYGGRFKLGKKTYIIAKPTISDYILYGLRRQTQIIYPLDSYQIVNLLGLQQGDVVFESGVGSGALALIMLNMGIKLFSFEKRQEFIDLASDNIARWQQFSGQKFDHNILHFDITEDKIEDRFVGFFDKGILDIKQPSKAKDNVIKILKPGGILIVWVPTANQVIDVLQAYKGDFFPDQIVQIGQNQWIRIAERFRPEDWQAGHRGFIIKFVKVK